MGAAPWRTPASASSSASSSDSRVVDPRQHRGRAGGTGAPPPAGSPDTSWKRSRALAAAHVHRERLPQPGEVHRQPRHVALRAELEGRVLVELRRAGSSRSSTSGGRSRRGAGAGSTRGGSVGIAAVGRRRAVAVDRLGARRRVAAPRAGALLEGSEVISWGSGLSIGPSGARYRGAGARRERARRSLLLLQHDLLLRPGGDHRRRGRRRRRRPGPRRGRCPACLPACGRPRSRRRRRDARQWRTPSPDAAAAAAGSGRVGRSWVRGVVRSGRLRPGGSSPMSTRPRKLAPSTMITRGRADVTDHPALLGELHALAGLDVPHHHAADHGVLHRDVGLHHARRLDDERLGEGQLALHAAADREVLVTGELAVDEDGRTDDRVAAR